ncbi:uncharacterized protein PHALS_03200 [Plasmopara halstedii]|uniref:Uncharacterized protein n=1 Tax=Plasmopara halstedii TaxID=4781 RepID=A0A0P1AYJ3_PLAHL|nr:uncharacterized protein PHALS_03200 [Plasmopara halstedii]CEG46599.1 hypothetical protein PHALS_03200 [Plasmopara halstedii]|eukprot:XP_024582968.1 hypothetical protein PHALS_03200 [Plasmopara halstedii]
MFLPTNYQCGNNGVWALQMGCYLCVDPTTCIAIDSTLLSNEKAQTQTHSNEIHAESLKGTIDEVSRSLTDANFALAEMARHPEVFNWLFAIPVCLVTVSLLLVVRAHPSPLSEVQRKEEVAFTATSFSDLNLERNDNVEIEIANNYQNNVCVGDSEEAQPLLSEAKQADNYEAIESNFLLHV